MNYWGLKVRKNRNRSKGLRGKGLVIIRVEKMKKNKVYREPRKRKKDGGKSLIGVEYL